MRSKLTILLLSALTIMLSNTVAAEIEKTLRFNPASIDFGTIRETDGPTTKTIQAINISPDTTFIISARTSCGCSQAEYDARAIAPGDSTPVTITYDPTNRPGHFLKTAKIFTGEQRISNSFKIKGTVIPSRKHLENTYPDKAGNLRLSTSILNAGEIKRTEARPMFVGLYNDSDDTLPLRVESDNNAIEATLQPTVMEPHGIATLTIMIKGRNINSGENNFKHNVGIINSESGDELISIPVGGVIVK